MAKKKSASNGRFQRTLGKFGSRKLIALIIAIVAIGASAYFIVSSASADMLLTASCAGTKGKCTEQKGPNTTGDSVTLTVVARDSKTKKALSDYNLYSEDVVKFCYQKGAPGHPKGGCSLVTLKMTDVPDFKNVDEEGQDTEVKLCSVNTSDYVDGTLKKTTTTYLPCYGDTSKIDTYGLWRSSLVAVKDASGNIVGKVKIGAPFGYTTSKSQSTEDLAKAKNKALTALKKLDGKKYYINVKSKSTLSTGGTSSTNATTSTSSQSSDKYTLTVSSSTLSIKYGDNSISKRCAVSVAVTGADRRLFERGVDGNSKGQYLLKISDIPANAQTVQFSAYDTPPMGFGGKRNITTISFDKLKNIGENIDTNLARLGDDSRPLACNRKDKAISCVYAPVLREY